MSNENMRVWDSLSHPPKTALREIGGGRLKGFTDVNPSWRSKAMTEQFGICGIGWKFTIDRLWTEPAPEGQVFAWALVSIYVKDGDRWSDPIPGVGGNFLVEKEKFGLHANDEGFKMAVTDALGTAMKMLGVASAIYEGMWDGSKYRDSPQETPPASTPKTTAQPSPPPKKTDDLPTYDKAKAAINGMKEGDAATAGKFLTHIIEYYLKGTVNGAQTKELVMLINGKDPTNRESRWIEYVNNPKSPMYSSGELAQKFDELLDTLQKGGAMSENHASMLRTIIVGKMPA